MLTVVQLILLAFKNTLRKFYWAIVAIVVTQVSIRLWKNGNLSYSDLAAMVLISSSASIFFMSIIAVPAEYNRLKRLKVGLNVSDS